MPEKVKTVTFYRPIRRVRTMKNRLIGLILIVLSIWCFQAALTPQPKPTKPNRVNTSFYGF